MYIQNDPHKALKVKIIAKRTSIWLLDMARLLLALLLLCMKKENPNYFC